MTQKDPAFSSLFARPCPVSQLDPFNSAHERAGQTGGHDARTMPDFAEFVKKATTKPEFLSPLVDHLPKKAGVPTPKDILGYHIGTEKKLTYVADQQRYFRALEKALPGRVKTEVTGKTEEGRDIMVVYITSEANLKNLETNRQNTKKIADPRGLTDAQVQQLIATTKPHYHISAGLHSARNESARGRDGAGLSARGERRAVHPADSRQRDRQHHRRHRRRRPRSLRGLVLRLQDRRALRRRRELRRSSLLGQVRLPRQQPRHQLRRRLAARAPQLVSRTGCRRSGTTCTRRRRCSTPSAASRRRTPTSIRFSTPSCRSSRPTK